MATVYGAQTFRAGGPHRRPEEATHPRRQDQRQSPTVQHEEKTCWSGPRLFFYAGLLTRCPDIICIVISLALSLIVVGLYFTFRQGYDVIRFDSGVPFYLYHDIVYKREVALASAYDTANAQLFNQSEEYPKLSEVEFNLAVVYVLDDTSDEETLFTPAILEEIKALEESITRMEGYEDYCALKYGFDGHPIDPICHRQDSVISFFDPMWWIPLYYPPENPTVPSLENTQVVLGSKISAPSPDLYYTFANPQNLSEDHVVLTADNVNATVEYWAEYCSEGLGELCSLFGLDRYSPFAYVADETNVTVLHPLRGHVDSGFGIDVLTGAVNKSAKALISVFKFGAPQAVDKDEEDGELYTASSTDQGLQRKELGKYLLNNAVEILETGVTGAKVYWTGNDNGMQVVHENQKLEEDMWLLVYSTAFIIIYLVWSLESWWLGLVGLLMIFSNFAPAYVLYHFTSGYSYFGPLNSLAVFLVLGIGADDIFVFRSAWADIRSRKEEEDIAMQLKQALWKSGKAMFVTSLTTTVSFMFNVTSAFPAIRSFGILSAFLIACNFCSVIIIYPTITMVYHRFMHDSRSKGCILKTFHRPCGRRGYDDEGETGRDRTGGTSHNKEGCLERYFKAAHYPTVHCSRYLLVPAFFLCMGFYVHMASNLQQDDEPPKILPKDDQYYLVTEKITQYFFGGNNAANNILVQIPFGLQAETNRSDCDGEVCDPTVKADYGAPLWLETSNLVHNISDEYTQRWMLDFCDDVERDASGENSLHVYPSDSVTDTSVTCPLKVFKDWCDGNDERLCTQTHPELNNSSYIVDKEHFEDTFSAFLSDEVLTTSQNAFSPTTYYDLLQNQLRYEDADSNGPVLRYMTVEARLNESAFSIDYKEGIGLYFVWTDFLEDWRNKSETEAYRGASSIVKDSFVTDGAVFHFFFVQEQIVTEAFTGIVISLLIAFVILVGATWNWMVAILAIMTITTMVFGVLAFTVWNGWKLGVLEAVIFVMVVGFSVDYTIHLSDSYLESEKETSTERTKEMLVTMGPSVLSGACTTIGATSPILFAYLDAYQKFGKYTMFIIAQSLFFSLVFFPAMLILFGPNVPKWGGNFRRHDRVFVSNQKCPQSHGGGEHLKKAIISRVHGDTCDVTYVNVANSGDTERVHKNQCRLRFQTGDVALVVPGMLVVVEFFKMCCNCARGRAPGR